MSILFTDGHATSEPHVPVATLDAVHSRRRTAVVVGPLSLPDEDLLTARLDAMTAAGPVARLCLAPSERSTTWATVDSDTAPRVHLIAALSDSAEPAQLLDTVRALDDRALTVAAAGQWLAVDFSHGLGEIPLIHTLLDVLFGVTDPEDPTTWQSYDRTRSPLRSAALRTFGLNPLRCAKLLAAQALREKVPAATADVPLTDFAPSPTTRVLGLTAGQLGEFRARRDATLPGVSMVALFTSALWAAFDRVGLDVSDTVKIPFDVRRYLPRNTGTLASFSAGLDFTLARSGGPAGLQRAMTRATRTGRPVANLLLGSAKASHRLTAGASAETVPAAPTLQMLHSNLGWAQWNGPWPFTDRRKACMLVASDPATPEGLTVTSVGVTENVWFTAEFHRSVHDPDLVGAALELVPQMVADLTSKN